MRKRRRSSGPETSISLAYEAATAAELRSGILLLDLAQYLRLLLRNAELRGTAPDPHRIPTPSPYARVKVSIIIAPGERTRITSRVAPLTLSAWIEQLVIEDTANDAEPFTILVP